jgi:hypothetical protein
MRLWSIHPKYLDQIGLVALWREGLLAQKVLLGETKGYKHHPQLSRFRACSDPVLAIGTYLTQVAEEATRRGYRFDTQKIVLCGECAKISVNRGQIDYEWQHLIKKLQARSPMVYEIHHSLVAPKPHPLFQVVPGAIEDWERT